MKLLYCRLFHRCWMWAGGKTKECRRCGRIVTVCLVTQ